MANALVILKAKGPLPQQVQFNAPSDGAAVLFVSGSAWTQVSGGSPLGVQVSVDGASVGMFGVFTNEAGSHRALIPMMYPVQLGFGTHTLELSAASSTITDVNDVFEVVLLY